MKKTITLLIPVILGLDLYSQDSFLGLSMGASIPFGEYASSSDPFTDGYAGTNFVLNFDGSYIVVPFVGIGGTFSFGSNYADEESFKETILTGLNDKYNQISFPSIENAEFEINMGRWTYVNLMFGPNISVPLSFIHIDLRALGGISFLTPPEREATITWPGDQISTSQSTQVIHFGYLLGAGLRIARRGTTGIRLAADYYSCNPNMEITTEHPLIADQEETIGFDLPIHTLNITLGLSFNF